MVIYMKNIFGYNPEIPEDFVNIDGNIFITRKLSPDLSERLENTYNYCGEMLKKSQLPVFLRFIKSLSLWLGICFVISILGEGIYKTFNNAPFLLICTAGLFFIFVALTIYEKHKFAKNFNKNVAVANNMNTLDELETMAKKELGIPENVNETDFFFTKYIVKDNEMKQKNVGLLYSHYNIQYMTFIKNENLCIANLHEVMEIPLSSLGDAVYTRKFKERAFFPNWNKEENYNSPKYKKYKITINNQGSYSCAYFTVPINDIKGEFCLIIPSYDFDDFAELTKVRIAEN